MVAVEASATAYQAPVSTKMVTSQRRRQASVVLIGDVGLPARANAHQPRVDIGGRRRDSTWPSRLWRTERRISSATETRSARARPFRAFNCSGSR